MGYYEQALGVAMSFWKRKCQLCIFHYYLIFITGFWTGLCDLGICVARLSDPAIKKPLEIGAFLSYLNINFKTSLNASSPYR